MQPGRLVLPGYRRLMSITRRLEKFFAKRAVPGAAPVPQASNPGRSSTSDQIPGTGPASPQAPSGKFETDSPFPAPGSHRTPTDAAPPASDSEQTPALGASALLDAWKARESTPDDATDSPKLEGFTFPQGPGPKASPAPALGPVMAQPRHLAAIAPWFLAIGGAMALGAWLLLNSGPSDLRGGEKPNEVRAGLAEQGSGPLVMCPSEPVVPVSGDKDGKFPMQADVSGLAAMDIASFVVLSTEASAAGRERDAEVGLLMSCRIADKLKGAASVESADAKYRLGQHYANLSLRQNPANAPHRTEWLARAQTLLADSLLTYSTRFGDNDERSRLAASGLASVRQGLAQKMQPEPALAAAPALAVTPVLPAARAAVAPVPAVSPGARGIAAAPKLPAPSRPDRAAKPLASPAPPVQAREKSRPTPPALKECSPAVQTLGLCN